MTDRSWLDAEDARDFEIRVTNALLERLPHESRGDTLVLVERLREAVMQHVRATGHPTPILTVSNALSLLSCEAIRVHLTILRDDANWMWSEAVDSPVRRRRAETQNRD